MEVTKDGFVALLLADARSKWVLTSDDRGKAWGGSADRTGDPKLRQPTADLLYTGFRIARGEPVKKEKKD